MTASGHTGMPVAHVRLRDLPGLTLTIAVAMGWVPTRSGCRRSALGIVRDGLATIGFLPVAVTHLLAGWRGQRDGTGVVVHAARRGSVVVALRSDHPMWVTCLVMFSVMSPACAVAGVAAARSVTFRAVALVAAATLLSGLVVVLGRVASHAVRASERVVARLDAAHGPLYTRVVAASRPSLRGRHVVTGILVPELGCLTQAGVAVVAANAKVASLFVSAGMVRHPAGHPDRPVCVFPASLAGDAGRDRPFDSLVPAVGGAWP